LYPNGQNSLQLLAAPSVATLAVVLVAAAMVTVADEDHYAAAKMA
jgi:hypothetical protein